MKRFFLVPLFLVGTIAGFGSGFHSMGQCRRHWQEEQETRLAEVCANAALNANRTVGASSGAGSSAAPVVVNAPQAAPAPQSAPVQQISQAPAPIVIITGGANPTQIIPSYAPAPAAPLAPAPTAAQPPPAK